MPQWLSKTGVVKENVAMSWGYQENGLECPFPSICLRPAFVCVCVYQNRANAQSTERWNPVWTRRSVNPLSPGERGGRKQGTTTCWGTDTANHTHWQAEKSQRSNFCKPVLIWHRLFGDARHTDGEKFFEKDQITYKKSVRPVIVWGRS